ncbi:MAG: hypothetical protein QOC81_2940, partial [Thermoanaerobaculia bacterium]|nr:hypothetical protein [Thermoanaerobaculia bacterium]
MSAPDADGPIASDTLEVQRRMPRIRLEKSEILPGERLNLRRKRVEVLPES